MNRYGEYSGQWVTAYRVLYSLDCSNWQVVNTTSEPWTVRKNPLVNTTILFYDGVGGGGDDDDDDDNNFIL